MSNEQCLTPPGKKDKKKDDKKKKGGGKKGKGKGKKEDKGPTVIPVRRGDTVHVPINVHTPCIIHIHYIRVYIVWG